MESALKYTTCVKRLTAVVLLLSLVFACNSNDGGVQAGSGIGGSTARFAIYNDKLFAVTTDKLLQYSIADSTAITKENAIQFSTQGIETIFCTGNNLFIGADNGMYIVDAELFSESGGVVVPTFFPHAVARDPVVATNNYAYVTLRSGNHLRTRNTGTNEMLVVNVADKHDPFLVKRINMESPYGLGISDSLLFVCDNSLKVYNIKDEGNPKLIARYYKKFNDVIPFKDRLLAVGENGFYQYAVTKNDSLELLSKLLIEY